METVRRLRKRAAAMRTTAEAFTIESARKHLIAAAERLERLADEYEARRSRRRHVDDQGRGGDQP